MASIASVKEGARRPVTQPASARRNVERHGENDRTETPARFAYVVMMPVVLVALVALIVFYLTLPLR